MGHPAWAVSSGDIDEGAALSVVDGASFDGDLEETWCVDFGEAMEVMTTESIKLALVQGELRPSQKVWRDGHPCWQPISDFDELMPGDFAHERTGRFEVPERSGPRRIRRPEAPPEEGRALRRRIEAVVKTFGSDRASGFAFVSAVFAGILLGLIVLSPLAATGPKSRLGPELSVHARQILALTP